MPFLNGSIYSGNAILLNGEFERYYKMVDGQKLLSSLDNLRLGLAKSLSMHRRKALLNGALQLRDGLALNITLFN